MRTNLIPDLGKTKDGYARFEKIGNNRYTVKIGYGATVVGTVNNDTHADKWVFKPEKASKRNPHYEWLPREIKAFSSSQGDFFLTNGRGTLNLYKKEEGNLYKQIKKKYYSEDNEYICRDSEDLFVKQPRKSTASFIVRGNKKSCFGIIYKNVIRYGNDKEIVKELAEKFPKNYFLRKITQATKF